MWGANSTRRPETGSGRKILIPPAKFACEVQVACIAHLSIRAPQPKRSALLLPSRFASGPSGNDQETSSISHPPLPRGATPRCNWHAATGHNGLSSTLLKSHSPGLPPTGGVLPDLKVDHDASTRRTANLSTELETHSGLRWHRVPRLAGAAGATDHPG